MSIPDKAMKLKDGKLIADRLSSMVAVQFATDSANEAESYVVYNGSVYYLPNGHTAGTSWANTEKEGPTNIGGKLTQLKSAIQDKPSVKNSTETNVDLDVTDKNGNVIARFQNGHIKTLGFDSENMDTEISSTDANNVDLDFTDGEGNVIARFTNGQIETKGFNSGDVVNDLETLKDEVGTDYLVPAYWLDYLEGKEETINGINTSLQSGESFVFITDYHQNTNNKNSAPLVKHILEHTSVREVIYGGDTTDGGTLPNTAAALAVVRKFANLFRFAKLKAVRGNHDCEPSAYQTINQISDEAWYDLMIRPIEDSVVSDNKLYFYFDNNNQKIRHIVMDSGGMNDTLDTTQLTWMQDKMLELDSEWTVLIYQHMVLESTPAEETVHLITRGTKTLNAIGDVFSQLQCTIGALICGHLHVDTVVATDFNFSIIGTTCDSGGANSQGYDWNNPNRTAGTTGEQAFDVFSIDTTEKEIHITRIGAGSDRVVTY